MSSIEVYKYRLHQQENLWFIKTAQAEDLNLLILLQLSYCQLCYLYHLFHFTWLLLERKSIEVVM